MAKKVFRERDVDNQWTLIIIAQWLREQLFHSCLLLVWERKAVGQFAGCFSNQRLTMSDP